MHDAWIAFVRTGDPNAETLPEEWPRFDPERRAVMELGEQIGVRDDPASAERALWEGLR